MLGASVTVHHIVAQPNQVDQLRRDVDLNVECLTQQGFGIAQAVKVEFLDQGLQILPRVALDGCCQRELADTA